MAHESVSDSKLLINMSSKDNLSQTGQVLQTDDRC